MSVALGNTAFSELLSLTNDFSCCIYDADGRQLAVMDALPIHTNSMHLFLETVADYFEDDLPSGRHRPLQRPLFGKHPQRRSLDRRAPCSRTASTSSGWRSRPHQLDVGAPVPHSSFGGAEDIWQEGLTIPPVKIYERGAARRDVIDFYLANVRYRERLHGDLKAQVGATLIGVRKLEEICRRYGNGRDTQLRRRGDRIRRDAHRGRDALHPGRRLPRRCLVRRRREGRHRPAARLRGAHRGRSDPRGLSSIAPTSSGAG